MPPDRRPPRGGRLVPSVLGALWCKPHLTVPQRVPLQCARPWGGEAGPSRQWRGVSPPNGTGRCWSHGPGERCRRVNTCPATPPRQETLASSRPFDAIGPAPAPGWALPGDAAIALYGARHPQRHRFLQRCNAPARGAGRAPVHAGRMARCRLRPEDVSPVDALTAPSRTRALESAWCPCGPAPFRGVGSSRQRRGVSPPNGAARALSPSTIHAGESKSSRRTSCLGRVAIPESEWFEMSAPSSTRRSNSAALTGVDLVSSSTVGHARGSAGWRPFLPCFFDQLREGGSALTVTSHHMQQALAISCVFVIPCFCR
jgi:hypothetical protein